MLKLYSVFHLNLMYSSIEIEDRPKVIEKCYWPLLELVDSLQIPIGIELSGHTLENIEEIDLYWIQTLRQLAKEEKVELIGSGYTQIIGPLVPAKVNAWNQKLGLGIYKKILGIRPQIALVNEMTYSAGIVEHYLNNGYKAIIMDWNNPHRFHSEWSKEWRYYPQLALNPNDKAIPIIWNNSISFQKFQRYAQGEIKLEEYLEYLKKQIGNKDRFFSLYGNDAEIFDYRPSQYETEVNISKKSEWERIRLLFEKLLSDSSFKIISPSEVLELAKGKDSFNEIYLESPEQPIPVKKQEKYNITRWAVTGSDDVSINTKCYRIYENLEQIEKKNKIGKEKIENFWRKLCFLWGSDFRTHIKANRFSKFKRVLNKTLLLTKQMVGDTKEISKNIQTHRSFKKISSKPKISKQDLKIIIESQSIKISLNSRRGLAIDSLIFKDIMSKPLVGTLPHGYYDDITLGADFYSGHTIIEALGIVKITDLEKIAPILPVSLKRFEEFIPIKCIIKTKFGDIKKEFRVYLSRPQIDIIYNFNINLDSPASFKTGIVTFMPESFNRKTLYYKTVNGGFHPEKFEINEKTTSHSEPTNKLISSSHCLGATDGWIEIGDKDKSVRMHSNKTELYNVPMITYRNVGLSYFLRCYHSIGEYDETGMGRYAKKSRIKFCITGSKTI